MVNDEVVQFQYCRTKLQLADILTKALPTDQFVFLRDKFMAVCEDGD